MALDPNLLLAILANLTTGRDLQTTLETQWLRMNSGNIFMLTYTSRSVMAVWDLAESQGLGSINLIFYSRSLTFV